MENEDSLQRSQELNTSLCSEQDKSSPNPPRHSGIKKTKHGVNIALNLSVDSLNSSTFAQSTGKPIFSNTVPFFVQ
jgi:hypothetical protein